MGVSLRVFSFSNNFFFFGRTISAFSHRYEVKRPTKAFRRYLLLRSITLQETESPFSHRLVVTRSIGRFRVPKNLTFKARLSAKPLIWKWILIMMQIKLIFTAKVSHLASFWKWDFLELGNGLFILTFPRNRSQCLSTSRRLKKRGPGNKTESLGPVRGHHLAE